MFRIRVFRSAGPLSLAILAIALSSAPAAHASLLLGACTDPVILEGAVGLMECPVFNLGLSDVEIRGSFVTSRRIGPDFSDSIIGIGPVGDQFPTISALDLHVFQYLLFTNAAHGAPVDFGLTIISPIYRARDAVTHEFVSGRYIGGVAMVIDSLTAVIDFTDPVFTVGVDDYRIDTEEEYETEKQAARTRSISEGTAMFETPEPATLPAAALALACLLLRMPRLRRH
jgi:hypothetical protein